MAATVSSQSMLGAAQVPIMGIHRLPSPTSGFLPLATPDTQFMYIPKTEEDDSDVLNTSRKASRVTSVSTDTLLPVQPDGTAAISKRKRPLKLTPSQRERKRAIDREAQRSIRTKTKNYIAHLENLVKVMEGNDSATHGENNRTRELVQQLRNSQDEVKKLRETVVGVQKLVGGVFGSGPVYNIDTPQQSRPSISDSLSSMSESTSRRISSSTNSESVTAQHGARTVSVPDIRHVPPLSSSPTNIPSKTESPFQHSQELPAPPASDPGQRRCDGEMYYFTEYHLHRALTAGPEAFITRPIDDEDIAVRAVLHGWHEVEEYHPLDIGWQAIRLVDQTVFADAGIIERMAVIRCMRLNLLRQVSAALHDGKEVPAYYGKEVAPPRQRSAVIDQMIWPGFRHLVYSTPERYVGTDYNEKFRHNLKFLWTFDIGDAYTKDPITQRYHSSSNFIQRQLDVRCWTMRKPFFEGSQELLNAIPMFDPRLTVALTPPSPTYPMKRRSTQHKSTGRVEELDVEEVTPIQSVPTAAPIPQACNDVDLWLQHTDMTPQYWQMGPGVNHAYQYGLDGRMGFMI